MAETFPLSDLSYRSTDIVGEVDLSDPDLVRVDRLRLLTDPGFPVYDLSYCWGTLRNGDHVRVRTGIWQIRKGPGRINAAIIAAANEAGRSAKSLGMFQAVSILV